MSTLTQTAVELSSRLGDTGNVIWTSAELKSLLKFRVTGLYPTYYQLKVGTTTPSTGPEQLLPPGCRNLYKVGLIKNTASTRVRDIRKWTEGDGVAVIPKVGINIAGAKLVWSWTDGWQAPAVDGDPLGIPLEAEEYVIIAAQINAIEKLLADKVSAEKYYAIQVRRAVTEDDLATTLDALHVSLKNKADKAIPLPTPIK